MTAAPAFAPGPPDAIDFSRLRRVLVIKLRHHGDVLLTTPVFSALAAAAPGVQIDALVYRETLPLLDHHPHLNTVHCIDRNWKKSGLFNQARQEYALVRALRERSYDLVIHLTEHQRGAWLTRLLKPRWSVAVQRRGLEGFAGRFWKRSFSHLYRGSASVAPGSPLLFRHTVEQNLDALRRLGLHFDQTPPLLLVPGAEAETGAAQLLAERQLQTGKYILMQPTSRWFFKTWPVAQNAQLIGTLLARGQTILLSCAPDGREQAMIAAILAAVVAQHGSMPAGLKLVAPDQTLGQLAALIRGARLFIGIDSAPMHMAAAMGTPVVALFGPSSELTWGPWQVQHEVVTHAGKPCRPCGQDGCGGGKISDCLSTLPVERVLAAIDRVDPVSVQA
jgi:heptosyltransferase-3